MAFAGGGIQPGSLAPATGTACRWPARARPARAPPSSTAQRRRAPRRPGAATGRPSRPGRGPGTSGCRPAPACRRCSRRRRPASCSACPSRCRRARDRCRNARPRRGPSAPSTPRECASSTISQAPYCSFSSTSLGRSATSPSIEYRPSTTISARLCRWRCSASSCSSDSRSLWRNAMRRGARQLGADQHAVVRRARRRAMRSSGRHERADGRDVGGVAADERDRAFDAVELRQRRLQLAMQRPLAGDDAARRHGRAEALDRRLRGFRHGGVLVEPQVVVGREVDVAPPVDRGLRPRPRVMAAVEGIGDAEQLADLAMLDDARGVPAGRQSCRTRRRARSGLPSARDVPRTRPRSSEPLHPRQT